MEDKYGTITISYVKRDYFEQTNPNKYEYRATSTKYRVVGFGETPFGSLEDFFFKIEGNEGQMIEGNEGQMIMEPDPI